MRFMQNWRTLTACVICACSVAARANSQAASAADAEIRQVSGDLYEVLAGRQVTVFLVTADGIIVADPLNRPTALWLRDELDRRFPGTGVRYVVYTHHHFDRAEGASAFGNPQVVAHREFENMLAVARRTLPSYVNITDSNLNGRFDPPEIAGSPDAALVLSKDRNGDGVVTPQELYAQVRSPRITYSRRLMLMLGGKSVQLIHPGPAYSPDMTVLYFPQERAVFAASGPPVNNVPFTFGAFRPGDVDEWIHTLTALDFDTLLFADGTRMARQDLVALGTYLDAVRSEAIDAYERGESLERLQAAPAPAVSASSPHAAERSMQLAAIFRTVQLLRVQIAGAAVGNYDQPAAAHCAAYTLCAVGGAVPAITASAALMLKSGLGVVAELTIERQSWNTRGRPFYDEEIALRQPRGSVPLQFTPRRASSWSYALVGGVSTTVGDARGVSQLRNAFVPAGGRHSIHTTDQTLGVTAGADLGFGRRARFLRPLSA